jgi:hypothetical protein
MLVSLFVGSTSPIWTLVFPALGLLVVCAVAFFLMVYYSPLSDTGLQAAKASWSFSEYLLTITRKASHAPTLPDLFERYLPFATSYGLLKPWVRYFQQQASSHVPAWFHTSASSPTTSFTAFMAVMLAANTTGTTGEGVVSTLPPTPPNPRS